MNVIKIYNICQNKQALLSHLRNWKLIPYEENYLCPDCEGQLSLIEDTSRIDGWKWVCQNRISVRKQKLRKCTFTRSFRSGTFFSKTKLSIFQVLAFVNLWVSNATLTLIKDQLDILTWHTAVDWASFCREVLLQNFIENPEKIGGPGKIVEIDESKFGRRKFNRGHRVEGQWVFGGFERETGRIFMVTVEKRDTDTLLPIIEKWIEKGTTILSDCWKAYDCLSREGYDHLTVNHSIHFKDPETGVHTNSIECSWRHAKSVTLSNGRIKAHIPGNLARYMFYKRCSLMNLNRTEEFFRLAGTLYDPTKNLVHADEIHVAEEDDTIDMDE